MYTLIIYQSSSIQLRKRLRGEIVMAERICINVDGTKVCGRHAKSESEVREWFKELIEELRIPVKFSDFPLQMGDVYEKVIEMRVNSLKIPIKVLVDCGTSVTYMQAYIALPSDHPLRPLLKEALRKFYSEFIKEIEVSFWDAVHIYSYRYYVEIKEDKVELEYAGLYEEGSSCIAYLPLKPLHQILEKYLSKAGEIIKAIEKAKRIVDEVEEEMKKRSEDAEIEFDNKAVEWLRKRLRKSYLGVFDELEVE